MKKTVLVTGGAGFIGLNLVKNLLSKDCGVVVIDNFSSQTSKRNAHLMPKSVKTVEGSILNKSALDLCFSEQIDAVVHLAAKTGVRASITRPRSYYKTNVLGTLTLLEAMKQHGVTQLVFASSSSVYGDSARVPFQESDLIHTPLSPYAASKISAEAICSSYASLHKIKTSILRFFTAYGPGNRYDMAAYLFLDAIMKGKKIRIFGNGESKRDFTYVDDITEGIYAAIQKPFKFEIINLGNSHSVSVNTFVHLIEQITQKKARIQYLPSSKADMDITQASIEKAHALLSWQPTVDLKSGLSQLFHWYTKRKF